MQSPPLVQGAVTSNVLDPTVIWDEPLCIHHVFKIILIKLSNTPLRGGVALGNAGRNGVRKAGHWGKERQDQSAVCLLVPRELELGLANGLSHMFLVLQLGIDGHDDLAHVDPGHCALRLSRDTTIPVYNPDQGWHEVKHECPLERANSKVL